jgi:ribosomal protein S27AE
MKDSKKCPKCGGDDILIVPGWVGSHKSGQFIRMPGFHLISANIKVDRYVCGRCGYIEEWVPDSDDLQKLRQKLGSRRP